MSTSKKYTLKFRSGRTQNVEGILPIDPKGKVICPDRSCKKCAFYKIECSSDHLQLDPIDEVVELPDDFEPINESSFDLWWDDFSKNMKVEQRKLLQKEKDSCAQEVANLKVALDYCVTELIKIHGSDLKLPAFVTSLIKDMPKDNGDN